MVGISINPELCTGCGLCVSDCLMRNLELKEGKAAAKGACIMCGHCIAICPAGAPVSVHPRYDMGESVPLPGGTPSVTEEELLMLVRRRRSVRNFLPKQVEREVLQGILEAGRYTETGGNRQDLQYIVIQDELAAVKDAVWAGWQRAEESGGLGPYQNNEFVRGFSDRRRKDPTDDPLFFNAPALLIVTGYDPLAAGLALANVEQLAVSRGLGLVHMGFLKAAIQLCPELLGRILQKDRRVLACVLLGYPAVTYRRTVPRKPLQVTWM